MSDPTIDSLDRVLEATLEWEARKARPTPVYSPRGRPITTNSLTTKLVVDVPAWLKTQFKARCEANQVPMTKVVRALLLAYLRGELDISPDQ